MSSTPEAVRLVQLSRLTLLGYHKIVKVTIKQFGAMVPMPEDRPGAIVVVKPEVVSILEQMKLIDGKCNFDIEKLTDVVEMPDTPIYWRYEVEDGKQVIGISPNDCIEIFKEKNRIGAVVVEGIAIVAQNPDVLKHHSIDLPGSRVDARFIPYLGLFNRKPRLDYYYCPGKAYDYYGSASCKK